MKFKCPACNKILKRDLRSLARKSMMIRGRYKSYCEKKGVSVLCKKVKL